MAKYQFTGLLKQFEKPFEALKNSADKDEQKFHDLKLYNALAAPLREVQRM